MTGPVQTIGVSVLIDQLIAEAGLSQPQVSAAYLIGTLAGGIPSTGRRIRPPTM